MVHSYSTYQQRHSTVIGWNDGPQLQHISTTTHSTVIGWNDGPQLQHISTTTHSTVIGWLMYNTVYEVQVRLYSYLDVFGESEYSVYPIISGKTKCTGNNHAKVKSFLIVNNPTLFFITCLHIYDMSEILVIYVYLAKIYIYMLCFVLNKTYLFQLLQFLLRFP